MGRISYRIIKSTWGIAIDVKGSCEVFAESVTVGKRILQNVWLALNVKTLSQYEISLFEKGIHLGMEHFGEKSKNYLFTINEVNFSECDYQEEALTLAAWTWVNSELGIPAPKHCVDFDVRSNKYLFSW